MASINNFEELDVWKKARQICIRINDISTNTTLSRNFSLKDQMQRSSGSIMDNIAEGFGRGGNKEFHNFLSYAKGSCAELKSQIYRCYDTKIITKQVFEELIQLTTDENNKIGAFMYYLRNTNIKGQKFKKP